MKLTIAYQRSGAPPHALSLAGEFATVQHARELAIIEAQSTFGTWCVAFEIRDEDGIAVSRWEKRGLAESLAESRVETKVGSDTRAAERVRAVGRG